jgi:putative transcriptional regulator
MNRDNDAPSFRREKPQDMSNENIVIARRQADGTLAQALPDGSTQPLKDDIDWKRLREMTEGEVQAAALADPDAQPLTDADFARMKRVPRVKTLRRALHLTQEEFSTRYHIPPDTLRDWEDGRCEPDQLARAYLKVIASDTEGVKHALEQGRMDLTAARYERDNAGRIQKRVADIAITISVVRNIGFKGALPIARDFVAHLNLTEFAQAPDERAFIDLLDKKTDELQLRLQEERARQKNSGNTEAELWGSARKVLNVFLCEAYFNRALERRYNLREIAGWLEGPLDKQLATAIRKTAQQFGLKRPSAWPGIIRLDQKKSLDYQILAQEIAARMLLPARIYFEVVTFVAGGSDG